MRNTIDEPSVEDDLVFFLSLFLFLHRTVHLLIQITISRRARKIQIHEQFLDVHDFCTKSACVNDTQN